MTYFIYKALNSLFGFLLKEDGGYLLLENGGKIILDQLNYTYKQENPLPII